ncbi:MAG: OmcA/MtrC family decaheme c-type cytochrome [Deltaproteobacteria bacterium]|nr:OmcA/MtrC family decaheme c-type cytochrome [Deltaproteobacteria bacterium]
MHRSLPFGYVSLALVALMGCSGEDGAPGADGAQGATGAAGAQGATGPAGAAGADGAQGLPGEPGADGSDGRLAYFTGAGVNLEFVSAAIATDGTTTTTFKITDAGGLPLDMDGLFTEGAVSVRFILAYLNEIEPGDPDTYVAYTVRDATNTTTNVTVQQAATDSGGSFELLDPTTGLYRYTFGTMAMDFDGALTHTIAAYATRTVDGVRYVANETHSFRPDGEDVVTTREIVTNDACNTCHGDISAHGGSRKAIGVCITCHSPQTSDPDTGNTVAMSTMIHKIHMGASLPSVVGGTPYRIIGNRGSVHDYSEVHFPQENARCETCHQGAQGDVWMTRASIENCSACHDRTSFDANVPTGYTLHKGGAQPATADCTTCHPATGGLAPVDEAHLTALRDPAKKVEIEILGVSHRGPGDTPVIRFKVMVGGVARNILTSPLTTLRATLAGEASGDYSTYFSATVQGNGASGVLTAVTDGSDGVFEYSTPVFAAPADRAGSWTVALDGYVQPSGEARVAAFTPVMTFAVTGTVAERREVVSNDKCNGCHYDLSAHGGGRKNVAFCVMCHNPDNPGDERAPRVEGASVHIPSVDFRRMIHKIHAGAVLSEDYILGGFPAATEANPAGSPVNFTEEVHYPRAANDCLACHIDGTQALPLANAMHLRPTIEEERTCDEPLADDADSFCDNGFFNVTSTTEIPPITAACTSCHDTSDAMAHALGEVTMTAMGAVETCAVCHGAGREFDAEMFHMIAGE